MTTKHVYAFWAAVAIIACSAILLSASLDSTSAAAPKRDPYTVLIDLPDTHKPVRLGPVDVPVRPLP